LIKEIQPVSCLKPLQLSIGYEFQTGLSKNSKAGVFGFTDIQIVNLKATLYVEEYTIF